MIDIKEIEKYSSELLKIYEQIEDDLLTNIASKFKTTNTVTATTEWKLDKLQQYGALKQTNIKTIAKYSKKAEAEITKILKNAGYTAIEADEIIYKAALESGANLNMSIGLRDSPVVKQILRNATTTVKGYLNTINTTALQSANQAYLDVINQSYIEVSTGISTYDQAINKAVTRLADKGITGTTYKSEAGRIINRQLDTAIRSMILTNTNKTACDMQLQRASEWESNLVEVDSHVGARPSHAEWQGKIYMLKGSNAKYANFYTTTQYGSITGLGGINCSHHFYPFFEGLSEQTYKPINKKQNDKAYEDSQQQRKLEREIRANKRGVLVAEQTKNKEATNRANVKLIQSEKKLKEFTKETGRTQRTNRKTVAGFTKANYLNTEKIKQSLKSYNTLEGITTSKGIAVKTISEHFSNQAVIREVDVESIQDALINPLKLGKIRVDEYGRQSQRYTGREATININPETGTLTTSWKTSQKIREKLE